MAYEKAPAKFSDRSSLSIYFQEISRYPLLSATEEQDLFRQFRNGSDLARKKLVNSNLRLVVKVAKKYQGSGLDLIDLIQEGNLGLMVAVDKFDSDRGHKFSTFAYHWIAQRIRRSLSNTGRAIRYPVHVIERIRKVGKAIDEYQVKNERKPSIAQISEATGLSIKEVVNTVSLPCVASSLDTALDSDSDETIGDRYYGFEDGDMTYLELKDAIDALFAASELDVEQQKLINLYYGFNGDCKSLSAVGAILGGKRTTVGIRHGLALGRMRDGMKAIGLTLSDFAEVAR